MIGLRRPTQALLGCSGATPRLEIYDAASGSTRRLFELPPRQSVYALHLSPDERWLAIGTRRALLYVLSTAVDPDTGRIADTRCFVQDGGVLAACFVANDQIAISTKTGRCHVYECGGFTGGRSLCTDGRVVCALQRTADASLFGLALSGDVLIWRPPGELVLVIPGPPPPSPAGIVRMTYWPAAHALAWPARGGKLAMLDLAQGVLRAAVAHQGDFYAMTVLDEDLVTIGAHDHRIKFWRAGRNTALRSAAAPRNIVSATALGDEKRRLLLVDARGAAQAFSVEDHLVRYQGVVASADVRAVVGPSNRELRDFEIRASRARAQRISEELLARIGQQRFDATGPLHTQLRDLGHERRSLELCIRECLEKDDREGALRASARLAELVSENGPSGRDHLTFHAELLESVWLLSPAYRLYDRVASIAPHQRTARLLRKKAERADAVRTGCYCIDAGDFVETVIQQATAAGEPVTERFLLTSLDVEGAHAARLEPKAIVAQYNKIRAGDGKTLPVAEYDIVYMISQSGVEPMKLVTVRQSDTPMQLGLHVAPTDAGTGLAVLVLFDCGAVEASGRVDKRNEEVLKSLRAINSPDTRAWLAQARRVLLEAVDRQCNMVRNTQIYPRVHDDGSRDEQYSVNR